MRHLCSIHMRENGIASLKEMCQQLFKFYMHVAFDVAIFYAYLHKYSKKVCCKID